MVIWKPRREANGKQEPKVAPIPKTMAGPDPSESFFRRKKTLQEKRLLAKATFWKKILRAQGMQGG